MQRADDLIENDQLAVPVQRPPLTSRVSNQDECVGTSILVRAEKDLDRRLPADGEGLGADGARSFSTMQNLIQHRTHRSAGWLGIAHDTHGGCGWRGRTEVYKDVHHLVHRLQAHIVHPHPGQATDVGVEALCGVALNAGVAICFRRARARGPGGLRVGVLFPCRARAGGKENGE